MDFHSLSDFSIFGFATVVSFCALQEIKSKENSERILKFMYCVFLQNEKSRYLVLSMKFSFVG